MNREIKFKFWLQGINKMTYPMRLNEIKVVTDGMIPLQYTGLKDRNGKEIYEGDVLRIWPDLEGFQDDPYWDNYKVEIPKIYYTMEFHADMEPSDIEIIGNIYENPELLTP